MERWEATFVGTRVAIAVHTDDAFRILDAHDVGPTWQAGGCAVLAEAMKRLMGAETYAIFVDGDADHVVSKLGGYYFDADGAYTSFEMKEKHARLEGVPHGFLRKVPEGAKLPGIQCPAGAVRDLMVLMREYGLDEER